MNLLLITGIQMDTQGDDRCNEGIALYSMKNHPMKSIIVKDAIVDPFGTSSLPVYLFVLFCASRYRCIESDVPFWFCIDNAAICRL